MITHIAVSNRSKRRLRKRITMGIINSAKRINVKKAGQAASIIITSQTIAGVNKAKLTPKYKALFC